jgi:hypothetical protein
MSTVKISELTLLSNFDFDDEFVVVDDSAGVTKKTKGMYNQQNILGTVSQSGGDPTGAVIERGSNSNGEYVKFADGTLICTHTITLLDMGAFGAGTVADVYRTDLANWSFPATFISAPSFHAHTKSYPSSAGAVSPFAVRANSVITTTSAPNIQAISGTDTGDNVVAGVTAIGRWF